MSRQTVKKELLACRINGGIMMLNENKTVKINLGAWLFSSDSLTMGSEGIYAANFGGGQRYHKGTVLTSQRQT
ncbi:hypothetical protein JTE90_006470 [Oedothorax gibbosus]|uniref:Uncharacterized protein n=1 Tax=Oedothorax gibbosus TaxID=931172 RepID=A0AAV6UGP2_9ARAC|nr:hypothetical protein JTE90_006470 [Oedothorax gibbosus]